MLQHGQILILKEGKLCKPKKIVLKTKDPEKEYLWKLQKEDGTFFILPKIQVLKFYERHDGKQTSMFPPPKKYIDRIKQNHLKQQVL